MGHQRLGPLPSTRKWQEVVALIQHGASVEQVAQASVRAAEKGLGDVGRDKGVVHVAWLLLRLPEAAREDDPHSACHQLGLSLPADAGLMALAAAFSDAVDSRLPNNAGRTDLGEMAQAAAVETLVSRLTDEAGGLFDATPEAVLEAAGGLDGPVAFGSFARAFFGRFLFKCLDYYLGRTLPGEVGEGRRFADLEGVSRFCEALENHCLQAAAVVEQFSGEWRSKVRYERGGIDVEAARDYAHGACAKLIRAVKLGAGHDVQ
jgi:hypothetical protein